MKRSLNINIKIFLVTTLILTLFASIASAERKQFQDMSVEVPSGYGARELIASDLRGNKYDHWVQIYSLSNSDALMEIMLDSKKNSSGTELTLSEIASIWAGRLSSGSASLSSTGLYYLTFQYKEDISGQGLVYDNTHRNDVPAGKYCVQLKTNLISATTADNINNSIQFSSGSKKKDDDDNWWGCTLGPSSLAMFGVLFVFLRSKKR